MWKYTGQKRPDFAIKPGPGQESVWDYPRPSRIEPDRRRVEVYAGVEAVADSRKTYRVLETASPPSFYLPPEDVSRDLLVSVSITTHCEWKGVARYWALASDKSRQPVGWTYPEPTSAFAAIAGHFSFYPALLRCFVEGHRVRPQPGRFYGGWVTDEIVGPFKGEPGASHW
jgi:uncharacterized protein (DUF427 family)